MGLIASIDYALDAADPDGIATSQTPLAAGDLTLDGALASGGVATLGTGRVQRRVVISPVGIETGRTFTIEGTNADGTKISEELAGVAAPSVSQSARDYQTVTRVAVDAATAAAVSVGTNSVGATPWIVLDRHRSPFAVGFGITLEGVVTYQPQHTFDDVQRLGAPPPDVFLNDGTPFADPGATESQDGNIAFPVGAFRVQINSGTGTLRIRVIQAGIRGG